MFLKKLTQKETGLGVRATNLLELIRRKIGVHDDQLNGYTLWVGTQSEYDAITNKDDNVIYLIEETT